MLPINQYVFPTFNPSLAFRGSCHASEYPHPLLIAAKAGVCIASIWEGNPARDNGSVNPRLYIYIYISYGPEVCISKVFRYRIGKIIYKRDLNQNNYFEKNNEWNWT